MIYLLLTSVFLFYAFYLLLNILAGFFYQTPEVNNTEATHKVAVFYPCYKPNQRVVENLRKQKAELNSDHQSLFIISQEATPEIEHQLSTIADLFESKKFSHLPGNSYHHVLEFAVNYLTDLSESFDSVLLLDPDNYMDQHSISRLIALRQNGTHVALSRRKAYAKSSAISLFDGLSERLNDYMLRRSKMVMNLIPELSGSGMLMDVELFKNAVLRLDKKSPGMDKQLLIRMLFLNEDVTIVYDEKAIVLDEKTGDEEAFTRQRLRWFGNQYYNAFNFGLKLIGSRNLSLTDYGIGLFRPPRSFQLVFTTLALPFEMLAFHFDLILFPVLSLSAVIANSTILLFLAKEGVLNQVLRQLLPMILTALKNGATALQSAVQRNSTFIHTRVQK